MTNTMAALETAINAESAGGVAQDFFFLAMSYQRRGDAAKAQAYFTKATNWLAAQPSPLAEEKAGLDAFSPEAEEVLGRTNAK